MRDTRILFCVVCAVALAGALATGLTACGGSDGDDADGGAQAASQPDGASKPGADSDAAGGKPDTRADAAAEQQVRAAVARLQDIFYGGDVATFCSMYTPKAKREIAASGGSKATCESVMGVYAQAIPASEAQKYKARIVSVDVDGDKAIVRSVQGQVQRPTDLEFARVKGRWLVNQGNVGAR